MSTFQIKNRFTGAVQFECDLSADADGASFGVRLGLAVRKARIVKANLREALLRGSDLSAVDLRGVDLSGADLSEADLSDSNLSKSNLRGVDLSGANLSDSNLSDSNLSEANLAPIKQDFLAEVLRLPNELEALRAAIVEGRIDGSSYSGKCACLAGTLAKAAGVESYHGGDFISSPGIRFHASATSPRESFFTAISPGDTPDKNGAAAIALEWTDEAIAIRNMIRATTLRAAT